MNFFFLTTIYNEFSLPVFTVSYEFMKILIYSMQLKFIFLMENSVKKRPKNLEKFSENNLLQLVLLMFFSSMKMIFKNFQSAVGFF